MGLDVFVLTGFDNDCPDGQVQIDFDVAYWERTDYDPVPTTYMTTANNIGAPNWKDVFCRITKTGSGKIIQDLDIASGIDTISGATVKDFNQPLPDPRPETLVTQFWYTVTK